MGGLTVKTVCGFPVWFDAFYVQVYSGRMDAYTLDRKNQRLEE